MLLQHKTIDVKPKNCDHNSSLGSSFYCPWSIHVAT